MLGLSNSIIKPPGRIKRLLYQYTSSFDSSVGDLVVDSNAYSPGSDDYTLEVGQNAPGEATTNDWLKVTLSGDGVGYGDWRGFSLNLQTGGSSAGGSWLPSPHGDLSNLRRNMLVTIEYKIHCAGTWYIDGDHNTSGNIPGLKNRSGNVTKYIGSSPSPYNIALGSTYDISTNHLQTANGWLKKLTFPVPGLYGPSENYPAPGSVLYVKDLVVSLYNIAHYSYNNVTGTPPT